MDGCIFLQRSLLTHSFKNVQREELPFQNHSVDQIRVMHFFPVLLFFLILFFYVFYLQDLRTGVFLYLKYILYHPFIFYPVVYCLICKVFETPVSEKKYFIEIAWILFDNCFYSMFTTPLSIPPLLVSKGLKLQHLRRIQLKLGITKAAESENNQTLCRAFALHLHVILQDARAEAKVGFIGNLFTQYKFKHCYAGITFYML